MLPIDSNIKKRKTNLKKTHQKKSIHKMPNTNKKNIREKVDIIAIRYL
jgi:hypothetical protein